MLRYWCGILSLSGISTDALLPANQVVSSRLMAQGYLLNSISSEFYGLLIPTIVESISFTAPKSIIDSPGGGRLKWSGPQVRWAM
jgi:hypothetical protein